MFTDPRLTGLAAASTPPRVPVTVTRDGRTVTVVSASVSASSGPRAAVDKAALAAARAVRAARRAAARPAVVSRVDARTEDDKLYDAVFPPGESSGEGALSVDEADLYASIWPDDAA